MKIKFIKECQDKYNGTYYSVNDIYEFEEKRANEILKSGYGEAVKEIKKTVEPKEETKPQQNKKKTK